MAFNVAYNTVKANKSKGSSLNSFLNVYTNKKTRQQIYQKQMFDKYVNRSNYKVSTMHNITPAQTKIKYNKNRVKAPLKTHHDFRAMN